jgi:hypothetical protein
MRLVSIYCDASSLRSNPAVNLTYNAKQVTARAGLAWTFIESLLGSWRSLPIEPLLSIIHDIVSTGLSEVCGKASDHIFGRFSDGLVENRDTLNLYYVLPFTVRQGSNGTVVSRLAASSLGSCFDFGQASTLFGTPSFLNA